MEVFDNINVKCCEDNDFICNRNVIHACGKNILLDIDSIFVIKSCDYFGEEILQFYTICPYCGYIVLLDCNKLSDEMKETALYKLAIDRYLYKKNNLRSELIYLESISPSMRIRKL